VLLQHERLGVATAFAAVRVQVFAAPSAAAVAVLALLRHVPPVTGALFAI